MSQYKSSLQADQCEYNKEKYSEADQDKYSKKKYTDKIITMVSRTEGIIQIQAKAVILAWVAGSVQEERLIFRDIARLESTVPEQHKGW